MFFFVVIEGFIRIMCETKHRTFNLHLTLRCGSQFTSYLMIGPSLIFWRKNLNLPQRSFKALKSKLRKKTPSNNLSMLLYRLKRPLSRPQGIFNLYCSTDVDFFFPKDCKKPAMKNKNKQISNSVR